MPRALGQRALFQASLAATVVGLEAPPGSRNLEIKPYAVAGLTSDVTAMPQVCQRHLEGDIGVDVKYGLTQNLTADFTYNTDFAQVEADEQQVNLTRFSLFFPEKREFFLENRALFAFGGVDYRQRRRHADSVLQPADRIRPRTSGADRGRRPGHRPGGSLQHRHAEHRGPDEQAGSPSPSTNFSVVRVEARRSAPQQRRPHFHRALEHRRRHGRQPGLRRRWHVCILRQPGGQHLLGAHADRRLSKATRPATGRSSITPAIVTGCMLERLVIGDSFRPDVGFVRRSDMRASHGAIAIQSPPAGEVAVDSKVLVDRPRRVHGERRRARRDSRPARRVRHRVSKQRHASAPATATPTSSCRYRRASSGLTIPIGGYDFATARVGVQLRPATTAVRQCLDRAGRVLRRSQDDAVDQPGTRQCHAAAVARADISRQLGRSPRRIFTTHLAGSRVTYTVTPQMFVSALVQYNTGINAVSANVRMRWEYRPGSELFLVLNEQRDTLSPRFPDLVNRAFIVKINRLVRF